MAAAARLQPKRQMKVVVFRCIRPAPEDSLLLPVFRHAAILTRKLAGSKQVHPLRIFPLHNRAAAALRANDEDFLHELVNVLTTIAKALAWGVRVHGTDC
jgi:hypothetical protein